MPRKPTGKPNGRPRGASTSLTKQQMVAIEVEARALRKTGRLVGWGPAAAVAKAVGVTPRSIRNWRKKPHYDRAAARVCLAEVLATRASDRRASRQQAKRPVASFARGMDGYLRITLPPGRCVLWNTPLRAPQRGRTLYVKQPVNFPDDDIG